MRPTRISQTDLIRMFNDALDEQGIIKIGYLEYLPSKVLKEVDPTAYRCGLGDYADSLLQDGYIVEGYTDNTEPGDES